MKKFALITAAVLSLATTTTAQYTYDNAEDWIKVFGGALTGVLTAGMVEQSDNLCFKNAVGVADTAIGYALTS